IKGTEALTAPELLSAILNHATQGILASAVRVSRAWSYIALDKLWSGHDIKVIDLLRVLPLESEEAFDPPDLCLNTEYATAMAEEGPSFFHDLVMTKGLRMKKLKFDYPYINADSQFGLAIANLVAANRDSTQALELGLPDVLISSKVGHSLRNLKALDFWVQLARGIQPIQVLVEVCPHIAHFRMGIKLVRNKVDLLNVPGVRAILGWSLLSFEVRLMRNIGWKKNSSDNYLPLSSLAEIGDAFPELEDLGALFSYDPDQQPFRPSDQSPPVLRRPLRVQKLRLGRSPLPERQDQRDWMARFFGEIFTPGLRIERICPEGLDEDSLLLPERENMATRGRDVDPEWDALFQKIEELLGGVRIWVGTIPEDVLPNDQMGLLVPSLERGSIDQTHLNARVGYKLTLAVQIGVKGTDALAMPEILGAILDYATCSTLNSAARVSRTWSTIALDKLWSNHVIKVMDLLRILPLMSQTHIDSQHWRLQQNPTDDQWARFQSYASRVRSLSAPPRPYDRLDQAITEWRIEPAALFPRLTRIEWSSDMPFHRLSSFVTPRVRELCLMIHWQYVEYTEEVFSTIEYLAGIDEMRLQKFKLRCPSSTVIGKLGPTLADFITAKKDSIQTLDLMNFLPNILSLGIHLLGNLKALSLRVPCSGGGEDIDPMQALVKGCPHMKYLRIKPGRLQVNLFDLPGVRLILGWDLLSFEARLLGGVRVGKADVGEMARAWPKLKKLDLNWRRPGSDNYLSLPCLEYIGAAFPELEDLGALFRYEPDDEPLLLTNRLPSSSSPSHLSHLQKLRLGGSPLPELQDQRDSMAQFLANACPPGLRVERRGPEVSTGGLEVATGGLEVAEREKISMRGRDVDPEWDALFQKIEELQGGVRIWVGSIPEDREGVWF
ncbi:hypothetical protein FS837_004150, partial [Tulasnella sp. UAMH 9824]